MLKNYAISREEKQAADFSETHLGEFLQPLVKERDQNLDHRLVRTFFATVALLVHSPCLKGMLLSQLGARLLSPAHAPAGAKRLGHLLRRAMWSVTLIDNFLSSPLGSILPY